MKMENKMKKSKTIKSALFNYEMSKSIIQKYMRDNGYNSLEGKHPQGGDCYCSNNDDGLMPCVFDGHEPTECRFKDVKTPKF